MSLLEHLKSRYPDATIREGRELDLPCYIVSVDGMDLKVMRLHEGVAGDLTEWNGFLQKRPT